MSDRKNLNKMHFNPKFKGYRAGARGILDGEYLKNTGAKDILRAALEAGVPEMSPGRESRLLAMCEYARLGGVSELLDSIAPDHPFTEAMMNATLLFAALHQEIKGKSLDEAIARKIADDYKGNEDAEWWPGGKDCPPDPVDTSAAETQKSS